MISVVQPRGSISSSVAPVLSAANTNWQGSMRILAELCSSPQNEDLRLHIEFWNPQWRLWVRTNSSYVCYFKLRQSAVSQAVQSCAFQQLHVKVLLKANISPCAGVSPVTYYVASRWSNTAWIVNELESCFRSVSALWLVSCRLDDVTQATFTEKTVLIKAQFRPGCILEVYLTHLTSNVSPHPKLFSEYCVYVSRRHDSAPLLN